MPFTAAHVVAVLPGMRWSRALRLDPTCLAIGSMAPDFEYFVRGELGGSFGHTVVGIAGWGVPVTLAVAALYHLVVKWPALLALPARVTPVFARPWRPTLISAVVSAAIGDLTHIVWDGATHAKGMIVRRVPELATPYDVPILGKMVLHRILQHASTVVGMIILSIVIVRALRRHQRAGAGGAGSEGPESERCHGPWPPGARPDATFARLVFAAAIAIAVTVLELRLQLYRVGELGSVIVAAISGVLAGSLVAAVILRSRGLRYAATAA